MNYMRSNLKSRSGNRRCPSLHAFRTGLSGLAWLLVSDADWVGGITTNDGVVGKVGDSRTDAAMVSIDLY